MNMLFLQKELQELQSRGLRRSLNTVSGPQSREIDLNGQKVLNFCSNDYLGLANDQRIVQAAVEALQCNGFGAGASRLVCGQMSCHQQLEKDLAAFKKTESALVFSSGYMANAGIIPALVGRHDTVFCDKFNHASIMDGIVLSRAQFKRYAHADMQALEEALKQTGGKGRKLIVTDSVFSMDGDRAPLKEIAMMARRYGAILMVDEAHAFGVLGPHGAGLAEELGLEDQVDVQMGTLSKAAGCFGAYVCGTAVLKDYLINKSRSFIYTTAMPPAVAAAACMALKIIQEEPQRRQLVHGHAAYLKEQLKALGFNTMNSSMPIIPILVQDPVQAVTMSRQLLKQGIFVQAIRPPTVPLHTARLRVTVTAAHASEDLQRFLHAMKGL